MANKKYAQRYQQILKEMVPLCFAKEKLLTEIAVIGKVVKPLIEKEAKAVADLKTFVEKRSESIASQLAGQGKGFTPGGFGPGTGGPSDGRPNPGEAPRQITEMLGPSFLVFRAQVQEELKLSDEQKKKLEKPLQDAMQFFQKLGNQKPENREKERHTYVEKAQANLMALLAGLLQEEQFQRLRQIMLQREGLFALGNAEVIKELKLTDEQRQQFVEVVQEMQKRTELLAKETQKGGKPEEIGPKLMKICQEHVGRIEALLSDAQKKQWKELLGKPLDLGD